MIVYVVHRVVISYDEDARTSSSVVGVYPSSREAQLARARCGGVITQTQVSIRENQYV